MTYELKQTSQEKLEKFAQDGWWGQVGSDSWNQMHWVDDVEVVGVESYKGEVFEERKDGRLHLNLFLEKRGRYHLYAQGRYSDIDWP